jgi:hypothetical protein
MFSSNENSEIRKGSTIKMTKIIKFQSPIVYQDQFGNTNIRYMDSEYTYEDEIYFNTAPVIFIGVAK